MTDPSLPAPASRATWIDATAKVPPHVFFLISAIFHYLGPGFAVLLFGEVSVLGVAWLRIASAAVVFAVWRRPWRVVRRLSGEHSDWAEYRAAMESEQRCLLRVTLTKAGPDKQG